VKSEKPTQRRLEDEGKKGKSFNSRDLVVIAVLATGCTVLANTQPFAPVLTVFRQVVAGGFTMPLRTFAGALLLAWLKAAGPLIALCCVATAAVSLFMSRARLATGALGIDLKRLDPVQGFKNLFSIKTVKELLRAMAYTLALVITIWVSWRAMLPGIVAQADAPATATGALWAATLGKALVTILLVCLPIVALAAVAEYILHIRSLKMEKFEVKKEHEDNEGKPEIKQRRKEIALELLDMQTRADVGGSTLMLSNPTHIAIGLLQPEGSHSMAFVTVREQGPRARAALAFARERGIPVVRDVALARRVFARCRRYQFVDHRDLEAVLRLLQWLREVEAARREADSDHAEGLESSEDKAEFL
jgi:type III secretion protein U